MKTKWELRLFIYFALAILVVSGISNDACGMGKFPKGIAVELGAGYNQLFWSWDGGIGPDDVPYPPGSNNRIAISIAPTARILYNIKINRNFKLWPFIGYDRFGGRGKHFNNNFGGYYKDSFWWDTIELGSFVLLDLGHYPLGDAFIGCGLKMNRNIAVVQRYYSWSVRTYFVDSSDTLNIEVSADTTRYYGQDNWTNELSNYSYDLGVRAGWSSRRIYYLLEIWLGASNLVKGSFFEKAGIKARENHFRLILGYKL